MNQTNENQNNMQNFNNNAVPNVSNQQPIQMNTQSTINNVNQPVQPNIQNTQPVPDVSNQQQVDAINNNIQQQIQAIPTVEQNKQEFIDKTQTANEVKKEEKDKNGIIFLIIMFGAIFAAIFLLFPYLVKIFG